jgi:AraC-like DNA-binding protein
MITQFRTHVVRSVCEVLHEQGADVPRILKSAGMPVDADRQPWVEVTLASLHRFHDAAASALRDPLMGIHVGSRVKVDTWDTVQVVCRTAPTLGAALLPLPRLVGLANNWVDFQVTPGDPWEISHRVPGDPLGLSRHGNELWVMVMLTQINQVAGRVVHPERVWFGHPRHAQAAQVAEAMGAPVEFGAGSSGFALARADAELPLVTADPVLHSVLDRLTGQALEQLGERKGVAALVYQRVRESLSDEAPSLVQVARKLAMSPRSLQRALTAEGTSFRKVVDQARRDLSLVHRAHGMTAADTSERLGYADADSLRRAQARWHS